MGAILDFCRLRELPKVAIFAGFLGLCIEHIGVSTGLKVKRFEIKQNKSYQHNITQSMFFSKLFLLMMLII